MTESFNLKDLGFIRENDGETEPANPNYAEQIIVVGC
jgi:hypothetical protein